LKDSESNEAALKLYEQMGFHRIGRLFDYYKDPIEDVVLISKSLLQNS